MGLTTGKWDFKFWYLSPITGRGRECDLSLANADRQPYWPLVCYYWKKMITLSIRAPLLMESKFLFLHVNTKKLPRYLV